MAATRCESRSRSAGTGSALRHIPSGIVSSARSRLAHVSPARPRRTAYRGADLRITRLPVGSVAADSAMRGRSRPLGSRGKSASNLPPAVPHAFTRHHTPVLAKCLEQRPSGGTFGPGCEDSSEAPDDTAHGAEQAKSSR
jgi:hypothetical protein